MPDLEPCGPLRVLTLRKLGKAVDRQADLKFFHATFDVLPSGGPVPGPNPPRAPFRSGSAFANPMHVLELLKQLCRNGHRTKDAARLTARGLFRPGVVTRLSDARPGTKRAPICASRRLDVCRYTVARLELRGIEVGRREAAAIGIAHRTIADAAALDAAVSDSCNQSQAIDGRSCRSASAATRKPAGPAKLYSGFVLLSRMLMQSRTLNSNSISMYFGRGNRY